MSENKSKSKSRSISKSNSTVEKSVGVKSSDTISELDAESPELIRQFGRFGRYLHELFSRLPRNLRITRQDSVDMYRRTDVDARIRSLSYWLFIIASCGITTLGLIINSPAVIIGAMLISPLMAPIIGLGMGVAINDVYLTFKSSVNIVLSMLVAVATAALITLLVPLYDPVVPLHDPMSEIKARMNPTVLDMFVALFCGLVAALSSVLSRGNEILKSVAPGAAIGVALMPPLCVIGFGMGHGFNTDIMWGSFLLFVTNLVAITLVSSIFYYFIYAEFRTSKLIQLVAGRRGRDELLYSSRLNPLWSTGKRENIGESSGKRFWFPVVLLLLISYPLISSLLFLKQKLDVQNYIQRSFARIEGMNMLRGPETLNYGRQKVTGNIIYSSREIPDSGFLPDLQKEIQARFDGYRADLTLVRVAGDSDLNRLRTPEELSLDTSANTLHDEVRQAHAKDLVRRALELLVARFPDETGVITAVHINFSMNGMEKVRVFYAGDRFSAETNRMLETVFRKELRALRGNVHELELIRVDSRSGSIACGPNRNEAAYNSAFDGLKDVLEYSEDNPFLGIRFTTDDEFRQLLESRTTTEQQERMHFAISPDQRCIVRYELHHI